MSSNPQAFTRRPTPPRIDEMCICGRTRHQPMAACPTPQPAGRQRPATPEQVQAAVDTARRLLLDQKVRAQAAAAQAKLDTPPFGPDYP